MSDEVKTPKKGKKPQLTFMPLNQQASDLLEKSLNIDKQNSELKGISVDLGNEKKRKVPRLTLTSDPQQLDNYSGVRIKRKLLPDEVLKDIAASSHLIASILRARGNMMSMFGHLKKDRFDIGFETKIKAEFEKELNNEQSEKVKERIDRFNNILGSCGKVEGLKNTEKMSLPEYFYLATHNALKFGRLATEIIRDPQQQDEELGKFHRFRPVDAGTIKRTTHITKQEASNIRKSAERLLSIQEDEKVTIETDLAEKFPWVQYIENTKRNVFTEEEMIVHDFYPSTDVEHNGYPLTPIDTCISSITTHLSIEAYNKLFFQNGRAAKGMLVVKSDEIDQVAIEDLKQQYMASINNVSNSFRTPIFGVTKDDDVTWVPTESNSKDGEFQFLYDQIARNILSSFNMSPDELPGYGHLSKATTGQSLSESNNEYKLSAARDTGLRPLVLRFQEFLNDKLFPMIDAELSQICYIELSGLDAQTRDQEAVRLQQEAPIYGTYNEILKAVDREPVAASVGGLFPFSQNYQLIADKYNNVGDLLTYFYESPTAALDPLLRYKRDGFYMQYLQLMMQVAPEQVKALFAPRPYGFDVIKTMIQDAIEEDEE